MPDRPPRRVYSSFSQYGDDPDGQPTYTYTVARSPLRPGKPVVTYGLLIAIGATFIAEIIVDVVRGGDALLEVFAIHVDWMYRPWTLVTSTFAHASLSHLFFNGLFLYFFGPTIEFIAGRKAYLLFFFIVGALAGIMQVEGMKALALAFPDRFEPHYALGASGALTGLLGIALIIMPKSKIILFPIPAPIPLWGAGVAFILLNLYFALDPTSGIGVIAHFAGLALGLVYGVKLKKNLRRQGLRLSY